MEVPEIRSSYRDSSRRVVGLLVGALLLVGGCHPTEGREPNSALENASSDEHAPRAASDRAPSMAENGVAYEKKVSGREPTIAYVRYFADDGASPACSFEIFESGVRVATNPDVVECGLMSSPTMLSVEITGTPNSLLVFQQKAKGTNSYSLRRTPAGDWVVTKVEFVYPQDNLETGDIDIVRESADLAENPVLLNGYSPTAIRTRLVRSTMN